jgi:hypothetical protein
VSGGAVLGCVWLCVNVATGTELVVLVACFSMLVVLANKGK